MRIRLLGLAAFLLFISRVASAQGIIVPDCRDCWPRPPIPRPRPIPRVLNIKSVRIETRIESQVATTKVEQVFQNDTPLRLEGSYFFPLPESASISGFAIYDGEKRLSGEVVERGKARQIYNEIVRKTLDPGLLEYAGKDLFQANVFPIEPRGTRKIELTYTQVLKSEGGTVSYRYPLGTGRRLMPQPVKDVAANVEIVSPIAIKTIFSPTHRISVSREGERRAKLSFEGSGEDTQSDFQLYYSLSEKDFGLALLTHREPGKDGYFLLLLSPKVELTEEDRSPKDVVFVMDTSGSMSGDKIEKARAALRFGVESLSGRDRFNLVSFSGEEHLMKNGLIEATPAARTEAFEFIKGLRAEGGTNINDAMTAALRQFHEKDRPAMVVFVTDGLPTVGTTDVKQIINNATEANRAGARVFTFGVGYDVNTTLLDRLAGENKGSADYVDPKEDLEVKVSNFFAKVNYPVLSDLRIDFGGVDTDAAYPRNLPDLFKGSQLSLVGRYKGSARTVTLRLSGKVGSRAETLSFNGQAFPEEQRDNGFLPKLWATRRVGYLLEQIRLNGESRELKDEIVALGTRYGLVTPYTSFLITEDVKDLARRAMPLERRMMLDAAMQPSAPGVASGEAAVVRSRAEKSYAQGATINTFDQYLTNVRSIANKTFHLKNGVWTDADYTAETGLPKIELKFGSEEFFTMIERQPGLAEFFALGEKVIVVFKGKVYQTTS